MNIAVPSMADAPFHAPPDAVVLDLPFPPSVNRLWRSTTGTANRVYLSPSYVKWKQEADVLLMASRAWRSAGKISGRFIADIWLCPPKGQQRGDIDNRIKATLDYLQRIEIVSDDKHCQRVTAEWVDHTRAPHGCRVFVRLFA